MIPATSVLAEEMVNFHSDLQRPFLWGEEEGKPDFQHSLTIPHDFITQETFGELALNFNTETRRCTVCCCASVRKH